MVTTTTIRRLDIRATTQGVTESTKQLADLSKTHNAVAVATDKSAQRQLSAAGAYDKLLKSVDDNYRSQQRLASGQAILDRAFQQGLITAQEQARAMDLLREKYGTTAQAANDNAEGFRLNSEEALQLAGHLKTVAVAAYTLSPAFRQLVNPAIAAGLRTTGGALSAMSPAAATVAATIASRMMPALSMLARIAIPITIVSETIRAMGEITELGARKLEEFSKLSKDAYAAGVTTDFFLRQAESAKKFVEDADQATAALKRFREVTTDRLGGSEFGNRLGELTKAGNFTGNAGAAAYRQALTTEEKYRAVVSLISEAMERGERLAALDLASKFLPPEMTQRLRENGQLLREMQEAADRIKPAQLASAEDIGYANELKRRMEEAQKTIESGLKPLQRDLTQLGLNYQETWVNVTELMARAVTLANQLYDWLKSIPAFFASMGNSPIWARITAATGAMGLNSTPSWISDLDKPGAANTDPGGAGKARLAAMLSDANAVKKAMQEVIDVQTRVRGEMSKPIPKEVKETVDAVDRMINSLNRSIEMQKADAAAVGLGARALAEFRAEAQYVAAVQANGGKATAEQIKKFQELKVAAGNAAEALARARIASELSFQKQTMGMSSESIQIARQLASIYGNDVPAALASSEAATMRVQMAANDALSGLRDMGQSVFSAMMTGKSGTDALIAGLDNIAKKLADAAFNNLIEGALTGNVAQMAIGGAQAIGSLVATSFGNDLKLKKAQREWEKAGPAFEKFISQMSGGVQGDLSRQFEQALSQVDEFVRQAWKAEDWAAVARVQRTYNEMRVREAREFVTTFNAELEGLSDGLGPDSPFLAAVDSTKQALERVRSFVDDARTAFSVLNGDIQGNSSQGFQASAEQLANVQREVDKATQAATSFMLSLLNGSQELSKVQTDLLTLHGTATTLQQALVDLGMSTGDAASAIETGVTAAIQKLTATFLDGFQREINDALDQGYLNDAADLIAKRATAVTDAAALGTGTDLIDRWFAVQAQQIVNSSELAGDAFANLITQFPQLQGVVTEFSAASQQAAEVISRSAEDILNTQRSYDDRNFAANNDNSVLGGALAAFDRRANQEREEEIARGGQAINQLEWALAAERLVIIRDFGQRAADEAARAAEQALQEQQRATEEAARAAEQAAREQQQRVEDAARAVTSAQDALRSAYENQSRPITDLISRLGNLRKTLVDLSDSLKLNKSYSVLSAQERYNEAERQYAATLAGARSGDEAAQGRLPDALRAFLDESRSFNASTEAYYRDYERTQSDLDSMDISLGQQVDVAQAQLNEQRTLVSQFIMLNATALTIPQAISNLRAAMSGTVAAMVGGTASNDNGGGYNPNIPSWAGRDGIITPSMLEAQEQFRQRFPGEWERNLPGYATGGIIGNGAFGVDSVIARYAGGGNIALAGGEYVMPAAQTRANLPTLEAIRRGTGGNDNSALLAELQALRKEVSALRGDTRAGAGHVREGIDKQSDVQKQSSAAQRQAGNAPKAYGRKSDA